MGRLRYSLSERQLAGYVRRQLNQHFPDDQPVLEEDLVPLFGDVLQEVEHCFSHVGNNYFFDGECVLFNHLHGDQYAMFLYLLSRKAFLSGANKSLPEKLFLLNKSLHGIDVYYEIELPSVFLFIHPLGTVLGRGEYGEYFAVYQRCGVGSNHDVYPQLGRFLTMHPGSSVLGKSRVGDNVSLASDSLLIDSDVGPNSVYIGNPRDYLVRPKEGFPPIWRNVSRDCQVIGS